MLLLAAMTAALPLAKAATPAPSTPPADSHAQIVFVDPEHFTDARDSYTGTEAGRDAILDQLRAYMESEAKRFIPSEDHLYVSVTDVDLAGEFEPWRGGQWDDVRIVKDIYPPRINLSFRVTDASGQVIKEGKRNLTNPTFLMTVDSPLRNDQLRHEKTLLDDWFHNEFRDLRRR